jgi:hypothetical protein
VYYIYINEGNSCGALLRREGYSSVYPTMTLPIRRLENILSFESITLELREEFANRQIQLYGNIYIDTV